MKDTESLRKAKQSKAGTFSDAVDREYYSVFSSDRRNLLLNKVINPQLRLILLRAVVAS